MDVMAEMLRYIYTGKTSSLDKMADELLSAADKVWEGEIMFMTYKDT